jgi:hypothetical protein
MGHTGQQAVAVVDHRATGGVIAVPAQKPSYAGNWVTR